MTIPLPLWSFLVGAWIPALCVCSFVPEIHAGFKIYTWILTSILFGCFLLLAIDIWKGHYLLMKSDEEYKLR